MPVISYGLDREVFQELEKGRKNLKEWKGKASDISDYVASWGIVRFWALSRSSKEKGGKNTSDGKNYFAWEVARKVLCRVIDKSWEIKPGMETEMFQHEFYKLDINDQVLLAELLMEIGETIQFWTMRFSDSAERKKTS